MEREPFMFDFELAEADLKGAEPEKNGGMIEVYLDAEQHKIFESQTTAYAAGNEVLGARDNRASIEQRISDLNKREAEIKDQIEALKQKYAAQLAELNDGLKPLQTERFDLNRERRQAELALANAEQKLRDALAFLKQQAKYQHDLEKYNRLTMAAPWREWAKEYQIEGGRMIASAGGRAILGDKMGLGKTLTSQIATDMMESKKVLIVVPDDVVSNFLMEIAHWAPHRTAFLVGKMTRMQRDIILNTVRMMDQFTLVLNYSAWRKDKGLLRKLINLQLDTVILDEAHSVKNVSTSAFNGVNQIIKADNACPGCGGYVQHVHDSGDLVHDGNYRFMPRDFFVCIGKHFPSSETVDFLTVPVDNACGWSQRNDIVNDVERPYGYLRSVKHVLPMTGTPILNKPQDLFALLNLIDDEHFPNEKDYLYAYCQKNTWTQKWEFRYGGLESLTKQLAGRYIARDKKTAGVVLPPQEVRIHSIELDETLYPKQANVIKMLSHHAMLMLESGKKVPVIAMIALITRKRQANVWPAGLKFEYEDADGNIQLFDVGEDVQESIKLDRIITEPERTESGDYEGLAVDFTGSGDKVNGERVVVFSQFKGPLKELERRMNNAGISCVRFDGDTPEDLRNEVKRDFDRKYAEEIDYKWQVVLCNYKTGGVGLNFTAATQMIIIDEEWNVGKNEQAYARIDRMGQTEETTVHILRLSNTVDSWMAALIENKRNMVEGFESSAEMQAELFRKMQNGEIL